MNDVRASGGAYQRLTGGPGGELEREAAGLPHAALHGFGDAGQVGRCTGRACRVKRWRTCLRHRDAVAWLAERCDTLKNVLGACLRPNQGRPPGLRSSSVDPPASVLLEYLSNDCLARRGLQPFGALIAQVRTASEYPFMTPDEELMNDNTEQSPADTEPEIPPEIVEAARLAPDHWLGMVDPAWSGEGEPPNWAVVGQWRSGLNGEIEEWRANEEYRPSPRALGWPEPTDLVDKAVQLAATGYGPGDAVPQALATAEFAILLGPGGLPLSATSPDGESVVPAFTSPTYLHTAGRFGYELAPVTQVVDRIPPEHMLYLNPSGPVSMTVDIDALRASIDASVQEEGNSEEKPAGTQVSSRPSTISAGDIPASVLPHGGVDREEQGEGLAQGGESQS